MKKLSYILLAVLCILCSMLPASAAETHETDLSPAIEYIRANISLDKCSVIGEKVSFTDKDFSDTIGKSLEYIVITSLPENGILTLNGIEVLIGQTIPASSLSYLKYVPTDNETGLSSFTFKCRESGWENTDISCNISILENVNLSPVAYASAMKTFSEVKVFGKLEVTEPEGDDLTYTIAKYPKNGTATIYNDGKITYVPKTGYKGTDTLVYYATDVYGNKSVETTVTIEVEKNKAGIVFDDMKNSEAHLAAIKMAEGNIMTYAVENDVYVFYPEETVTRIDFLVMLMNAAGLDNDLTIVTDTEFVDDTEITNGRKGYLARAAELGIVDMNDGYFKPLEPISKADAAVMTARVLSLPEMSAMQTFADTDDIPSYAAGAVGSVTNIGLISGEKGFFSPLKSMSKDEIAVLLVNVLDYMEDNKYVPASHLTK